MNELQRALIADSAAAPAGDIVKGLEEASAHCLVPGDPHSIYSELWHVAFWQQVTLDWIDGLKTPVPLHAAHGFPPEHARAGENWDSLHRRFLAGLEKAGAAAPPRDEPALNVLVRCPSRAGKPVRTMTVREQLDSLAAHNAYHLERIVLLRQILRIWPPPSGGFTW